MSLPFNPGTQEPSFTQGDREVAHLSPTHKYTRIIPWTWACGVSFSRRAQPDMRKDREAQTAGACYVPTAAHSARKATEGRRLSCGRKQSECARAQVTLGGSIGGLTPRAGRLWEPGEGLIVDAPRLTQTILLADYRQRP